MLIPAETPKATATAAALGLTVMGVSGISVAITVVATDESA